MANGKGPMGFLVLGPDATREIDEYTRPRQVGAVPHGKLAGMWDSFLSGKGWIPTLPRGRLTVRVMGQ